MYIETCPCCPRGCTLENLHCSKGKIHFHLSVAENNKMKDHFHITQNMSLDEKVISLLRKCGHHLHHSSDIDSEKLLSCFNEDEKMQFIMLLEKVIKI